MKINIGSGYNIVEGFKNLDKDPQTNPDYLTDVESENLPFEDNSVDAVILSHILEHLGSGYFHFLKELYRVSKNGTKIYASFPHHRNDSFFDDPTHVRPITVRGLKMLSQKHNKLADEQNAMCTRLARQLEVDFEIVDIAYTPEAGYENEFSNVSKEEAEKYISQHCNIISDVNVTMIVIKDD